MATNSNSFGKAKNMVEAKAHAKKVYASIQVNDSDYNEDYVIYVRENKDGEVYAVKTAPYSLDVDGTWMAYVVDEDIVNDDDYMVDDEIKISKYMAKTVKVLFDEGTDDIDEAMDVANEIAFEMLNDKQLTNAMNRKAREKKDIEMSRKFCTSTTSTIKDGVVIMQTTSSAPADTKVEIEHKFDPCARLDGNNVEGSYDEDESDICTSTAESEESASSDVACRLKAVRRNRVKAAKQYAAEIGDANAMTWQLQKQMEELKAKLEAAKEEKRREEEARRKAEEEARILEEIKAEEESMEIEKNRHQETLNEIKSQQEDIMRMMREMQKELEALKS